MFLISPWVIPAALSHKPLGMIALIWPPILAYSVGYYGLKQKNRLFVLGTITKFLVGNEIQAYFIITSTITHLIATITDRIGIFGHILMSIGSIIPHNYQPKETKPEVKNQLKESTKLLVLQFYYYSLHR